MGKHFSIGIIQLSIIAALAMNLMAVAGMVPIKFGIESAQAELQTLKPKIKKLDLNFSCNATRVKTVDECYYKGIELLNQVGCKVQGAVTSSNCGASEQMIHSEAGNQHVITEWSCSIPSTNCKENLDELCPLKYKEMNLRNKDIAGNGRVFMHFLSYCMLDPVDGRKDPSIILPNATPVAH